MSTVLECDTVAALRAVTAPAGTNGARTFGYTTLGDQGGAHYWYDSASSATDDGVFVIKPTNIGAGSPGRWRLDYRGYLNVQWFGAKGNDSTHDDAPAFAAAWSAAGDGDKIYVPAKTYYWKTAISVGSGDEGDIVMYGDAAKSIINVTTGDGTIAMHLTGYGSAEFRDLTFVGTLATEIDCSTGILFESTHISIVRNCAFYGTGTRNGMIRTLSAGLVVEHCAFYGCEAAGGGTTGESGVVVAEKWVSFDVFNTLFQDYGNLNGNYYSKSPNGVASWIYIGEPTGGGDAGGPDSRTSRTARVRSCGFDEGATYHITVLPTATWIDAVLIEDCDFLAGVTLGIWLQNVKRAKIERCDINPRAASNYPFVAVEACGVVTIEDIVSFTTSGGTTRVTVDGNVGSGTSEVTLRECQIDSFAPSTSTAALLYWEQNGTRARVHFVNGTIAAGNLVKLSTTAGRVEVVGTSDDDSVVLGASLNSGSAVGTDTVFVAELVGEGVTLLSDGAVAFAPGDKLTASSVTAGRVAKSSGMSFIARSLATVAATAGASVAAITAQRGEGAEAWKTPTLATGISNYTTLAGAPAAAYRKNAEGRVQLRGWVKGASSQGQTLFTLPSGYRPLTYLQFPVTTDAGGLGLLQIDTSGNVKGYNCVGGSMLNLITLDNCTFYVD